MNKRWLPALLAAWMLMASLGSSAQVVVSRFFPPNVKRGVLDMSSYPNKVSMNGATRKFSPALKIFSTQNLIVLPGTLNASQISVNYAENSYGDIDKVWILSNAELAANPVAQPLIVPAPVPAPAPASSVIIQ